MKLENILEIYNILEKETKKYKIPLEEQKDIKRKEPFFVLIGTILSARTKDQITKNVCDTLFLEVRDFKDLEKISLPALQKLIYPVGFYKQKAKNLKKLAEQLREKEYKIPNTLEELIKLPGVGRKTANLVLDKAFDVPAVCVDIHVFRITNRIGIVESKSPLETELLLKKILPKKYWSKTNSVFVKLGQNVCFPRNPNCSKCIINKKCKKKI